MKKILFFLVMIGVMDMGSLVYAADVDEFQQEDLGDWSGFEEEDDELKLAKSQPEKSEPANVSQEGVFSHLVGSDGKTFPIDVKNIVSAYHVPFVEGKIVGGLISMAAISGDGRWIVTAHMNNVSIWDREDISKPYYERIQPGSTVVSLAISRDGKWVVTADDWGALEVLNRVDRRKAYDIEFEQREHNKRVAISRDGRLVVIASNESLRVWDRESDGMILNLNKPLGSVDRATYAVATSENAQMIATASANRGVVVAERGGWKLKQLPHTQGAYAVAINDNGRWLVTGSPNGVVVYDMQTNKRDCLFKGQVSVVAIDTDGRWVVTGSKDKTIRIWNRDTRQLALEWKEHGMVTAVGISDDGRWIVTVSDGQARLWDVQLEWESSADQQLIDIIDRRIMLRAKGNSRETPGDIQRALVLIKKQIALGANPAVMVPARNAGEQIPLWEMAKDFLGMDHEITQYLYNRNKIAEDFCNQNFIGKARPTLERALATDRAIQVLDEMGKAEDDFRSDSKEAVDKYFYTLENIDLNSKDALEKIKEVQTGIEEEFEKWQREQRKEHKKD